MANKVFRQTLTSGVAFAGAGVIALTPVTVTPEVKAVPDTLRVVSAEVMPAGLVQDLQLIGSGAAAAVQQSVDALTRKIPDLWWTVHEHWPDADLLHWNYALVSDILLAPITPLVIGPLNDAVAEAVARNFPVLGDQIRQVPEFLEYAFVRLVGPLLSAIGGAGVAHSEIFYSMTTYRIEPFIEAIVRAPFHVIDGLLFGGYGDLGPLLQGEEGNYIPAPGLLTPWGKPPRVRDIKTPNDIVTSVPDVNAAVISLVTDRSAGAAAEDTAVVEDTPVVEDTTVVEDTAESPLTPAVEPVSDEDAAPAAEESTEPETTPAAEDTEGAEATAGADPGTITDEPETDAAAGKPAKPAKKDPTAGIRQGIKDFRAGVRNTVKKLTGGASSSRSGSQSGSGASGDSE